MKRFTSIFAAIALATTASFGQLADGSTCPDFTGTDLNGNVWNLYTLLDQGKTVIIDVSATWCGPCWNYHNTGALEQVYAQHGPDGDNTMMVLFIEGDPTTTVAQLNGAAGSQGNWVEGTDYPIIDDGAIGDLLAITYFPTVYRVCPDRIITEAGQITSAQHYAQAMSDCGVVAPANNVGLNSNTAETGTFCAGELFPVSATVFNGGSTNLTSCTIEVLQNGAVVQTQNWTGNLAFMATANVSLDPVALSGDVAEIEIRVSNPNNTGDGNPGDNTHMSTLTKAIDVIANVLTVDLKTDNYGNELYWQIEDGDGAIVASGGNAAVGPDGGGLYTGAGGPPADPGSYGNAQVVSIDIPTSLEYLDFECMNVKLVDGYGDGMCCAYGNGYFKVSNGATVLMEFGAFGATSDNKMALISATVGTENIVGLDGMKAYPNPSDNLMNVEFSLATSTNLTFDLYNAVGQRMSNVGGGLFAAGNHMLPVNTTNLAVGTYFIVVRDENNTSSIRFTVAR